MNSLSALTTHALLGTGRAQPPWPTAEGPLGSMLQQIPREPGETAVLHLAGVLGTCHLAGWQPLHVAESPSPAEADPMATPPLAPAQAATVAEILGDGSPRLQAEALLRLRQSGHLLPHSLLPRALDSGRRSRELRAFLLPVLGQRGAWLARQNEAWQYAAGGPQEDALGSSVWEHGTLDQRKLYLAQQRAQSPDAARELVAQAVTTEGAKERIAFVECLTKGLSPADEDLLESLLKDKSKEVRALAGGLLSCLPTSRYAQRMIARLQPCISLEKKFLRGTVLTLEAPAAFGNDWKADGLEEARPKGSPLGERAWWLFQIACSAPLDWWQQTTGMTPAELLAWTEKSDWKQALLQAWAEALGMQENAAWAEAFLSSGQARLLPGGELHLLAALPYERRLHYFQHKLTGGDKVREARDMIGPLCRSTPLEISTLPEGFAAQLLTLLRKHVLDHKNQYDWELAPHLKELACLLPPKLFQEALNGWGDPTKHIPSFAEALSSMERSLRLRQQLQAL